MIIINTETYCLFVFDKINKTLNYKITTFTSCGMYTKKALNNICNWKNP